MREPFETLLGEYREHWMLGGYLTGPVPDFGGMLDDPRFYSLSSGEKIICDIGRAIYNQDRTARVADLATLDLDRRRRVLDALAIACDV